MPSPREILIQRFASVPSTNDSILAAGEADAPEGTTHIAEAQTRGRGRMRRAWWSPPGAGVWMSTLLRPSRDRSSWGGVALIAGVATRNALTQLGLRNVEVFWPNDLEVAGRKLGGILCEVRAKKNRAWMALGIGINLDLTRDDVRRSMPRELHDRVTCATREGPPHSREPDTIARTILRAFWPLYDAFLSGASPARLVEDELAHRGGRVRVQRPDGSVLKGTLAGLGPLGELRVKIDDEKTEDVMAGDVTYLD